MIPTLTNHFGFLVDKSGSMGKHTGRVVKVFDAQIAKLRSRSLDLNQETRVSVYLFNSELKCLVFDMDVMRMPSLDGLYSASGGTALRDCTRVSISEMQKICQLHSDHAFLLYVLTDGYDESSWNTTPQTLNLILNQTPDNWTVAALVPDAVGRMHAKQSGFSDGNIEIWSTDTGAGLDSAAVSMQDASERFMQARATGVRSTKNLFKVDLTQVKVKDLKSVGAPELSPSKFKIFEVTQRDILANPTPDGKGTPIRPFVERKTGKNYQAGSGYYMLDKREEVQGHKEIALRHQISGKVYAGKGGCRELLGLPDDDIKMGPGDHGTWDVFIQSTSVNRKLYLGNEVLVMG